MRMRANISSLSHWPTDCVSQSKTIQKAVPLVLCTVIVAILVCWLVWWCLSRSVQYGGAAHRNKFNNNMLLPTSLSAALLMLKTEALSKYYLDTPALNQGYSHDIQWAIQHKLFQKLPCKIDKNTCTSILLSSFFPIRKVVLSYMRRFECVRLTDLYLMVMLYI